MKLFKSTAIVSVMTLLSRLLGMARDMLVAVLFGAGPATDAFLAAFKIPNYFRRLFAEGSFALAFVPSLAEVKEKEGKEAVRDFIDHVSGLLMASLMLVTALGVIFPDALVAVFVPGFLADPEKHMLVREQLRITFPYLMLVSLTGLAGGILNTYGRFALPALTPVLLNVSIITSALLLHARLDIPVLSLAWGVFAGGVLQLLAVMPFLYRLGLFPKPRISFAHPGVRKVLRLMLPTLFSSSVAQLNLLLDTLLASFLVTGSVTWLYLSDRLLEFPLGVFGIALATVVLPTLSKLHARNDRLAWQASLDWALQVGLLIALPAAAGLALLAEPIYHSLFRYGAYTEQDATMAGWSLSALAAGLPAFVLVKILQPAFFARQDTRTPVKIAIYVLSGNMVMNVVLLFLLAMFVYSANDWASFRDVLANQPGMHVALAGASVLAAWLNVYLLYRALAKQGVYRVQWSALSAYGRLLIASVLMSAALYLVMPDADVWQGGLYERMTWLLAMVVTGVMVYWLALVMLAYPLRLVLSGKPG